jgi:hypothetical protein
MKRFVLVGILAICYLTPNTVFANAITPLMPIAKFTPGAINPDVTQENIGSTICLSGYTKTIRPPSSYTTTLKIQQLATTYSFYHDSLTGDFEEDHLISLELGGSPTSEKNLWPEPYVSTTGARIKDKIENKLHSLVCSHQITLAAAQKAIASNWYAAYLKYLGIATVSSGATKSTASAKPKATVNPSGSWPAGATGKCVDGTFSYSANHRGMCSRHGGVAVFKS